MHEFFFKKKELLKKTICREGAAASIHGGSASKTIEKIKTEKIKSNGLGLKTGYGSGSWVEDMG